MYIYKFIQIYAVCVYTYAIQFGQCSPPRVLDAFHDVVGLLDVGTAAGPRAWNAWRYRILHGFCGISKSESPSPNFLQWFSFRFHINFLGNIIAGANGKSVVFHPRFAAPRSKAAWHTFLQTFVTFRSGAWTPRSLGSVGTSKSSPLSGGTSGLFGTSLSELLAKRLVGMTNMFPSCFLERRVRILWRLFAERLASSFF